MAVRKGLALGFFVGGVGALLLPTAVGARLEGEFGLRLLFALRGTVAPPTNVVIVSLDQGSAQQLGMDPADWPPPRHVHADVIRALDRRGVSVIVLDVWFARRRSTSEDEDLARAMAQSGRVVLVQRVDRQRAPGAGIEADVLQSPIEPFQQSVIGLAPFPLPRGSPTPFFWPFFATSVGIVPTLPAMALQVHALPLLDRLTTIVAGAGAADLGQRPGQITSSADLRHVMQALRRALSGKPSVTSRVLAGLDAVPPAVLAPTDRGLLVRLVHLYAGSATYYLNLYGPPGSIETIPFHELLQGPDDRYDLRGKVVFVGESPSVLVGSAAQRDRHPTVYSTRDAVDLSGTEMGATAVANLLTDRVLRPIAPVWAFAVVFAFGALVGFLARLLPGTRASGMAVGVALVALAVAHLLFVSRSLVVPLAVPGLVQLPVALFLGVLFRYRDIRRQTPIEIDPDARHQLFRGVCLTTDVEGYTALAAHLSPTELKDLLSEYHQLLRTIVVRHRGLVWGRGGDSALCVWKASSRDSWIARALAGVVTGRRDADHEGRLNACLAAIDIRDSVVRFNARRSATRQLPTRIGLDAGLIGLGPVAGELQAVGNPANAATRIQELNKLLSTRLLASSAVVDGLADLTVRPLGRFTLHGTMDAVQIVEIRGARAAGGESDRLLSERFATGLALFEAGHWSAAAVHFDDVVHRWPEDGPARYYRDLSNRYARDGRPPGVLPPAPLPDVEADRPRD